MKNHASKKCVVPNCSTTSSNKQKLGKSLFKFPARGTEKHQQWLKQLGLEQNGRVPSWKMHICSDHFTAEHYEQNYRHELMGTNYPVRFLRPNAVPIPYDVSVAEKLGAFFFPDFLLCIDQLLLFILCRHQMPRRKRRLNRQRKVERSAS